MPQVGNKKFPYTDDGMKAAKAAAMKAAKAAALKAAMKNAEKVSNMKNAVKKSDNPKATTLPAMPGKTKKKM